MSSCWRRGCLDSVAGSPAPASLPSPIEGWYVTDEVGEGGKGSVWGVPASPSVVILHRLVVPMVELLSRELRGVWWKVDSVCDALRGMLCPSASAVVVGLRWPPASEVESTGLDEFSSLSSFPLSSGRRCRISPSSWWQSSSRGTKNVTGRRDRCPHSSTSAVRTTPWKMYWKATKSYCTLAFNCFVFNPLWRRKGVKFYCTQAFGCFTSKPRPWLHFNWWKCLGCSSGGMRVRSPSDDLFGPRLLIQHIRSSPKRGHLLGVPLSATQGTRMVEAVSSTCQLRWC